MEQDKKLSTEVIQKEQDTVSLFGYDQGFIVAYKKTEKLASAVYMITNLFPESEPMKWTLRKKVGELLSFMLAYKDTRKSVQNEFVYDAKSMILELISLLEVSSRGGLISNMNFSILKQEFLKLVDVLVPQDSTQNQFANHTLSQSFFAVPSPEYLVTKPTQVNTDHVREDSTVSANIKVSHDLLKDKMPKSNPEDLKRSNRQSVILGLVRKKGEITIKDVSQIIKDCSEKTIQRELMSFISTGVLKKTGERRWSKYSLV